MLRPPTRTVPSRLPLAVLVALAALTFLAQPTPARAAITLIEGDKGKLEMEIRLMAWAAVTGPDLIPGTNSTPPPTQEQDIEDFFVRRARILFRAQLSKSLEVFFQVGQDNIGSKILKDDAGFRFKDAMLNYKHADLLQVAVGQFKVPFLRQNLCSGFNQLLVDRSLVTTLRPAVEGSRDEGGMVWGSHGGFQYRAAVFDGSDQEDTNAQSSLRGTVRVSWNWFTPEPGLGYTGTSIGEKRVLQVALQGDAQNRRSDARDDPAFATALRDYTNWAAEVYYDQPFGEHWAFTGEGAWLQRRDVYETAGFDTRDIDGAYAQAGLLLPWNVGPGRMQIAGRWEEIQSYRGSADSSIKARTIGINWFGKGHERKIQFDYGKVHERPVDLDDDFYRLSMVVTF
jgi:hypothetical protein